MIFDLVSDIIASLLPWRIAKFLIAVVLAFLIYLLVVGEIRISI